MPYAAPPTDIFRHWQTLAPTALPPKKEAREMRAAITMAKRPRDKVRVTCEARTKDVLAGLLRFKLDLTHNRWGEMLQTASALKANVHLLRICVRAKNLQSGTRALPPRAVQFARVRTPLYALAWANALDNYMLAIGRQPGPLIALWNVQCAIAAVPEHICEAERAQARTLREEQALLGAERPVYNDAWRIAYNRKHRIFNQGLLLDELAVRIDVLPGTCSTFAELASFTATTFAVGRLRAAVQAYQHPMTPLPPHPEQYLLAGGTWTRNRRFWREAMLTWLDGVAEAAPPAYARADNKLPCYRSTDNAARRDKQQFATMPRPWIHWPRRFLPRS